MSTLPQNVDNAKMYNLSAKLAFELAADIHEPKVIIARYGLSEDDMVKLLKNPAFVTMLKEAKKTWSSNLNAAERIQVKSRVALEELVPEFYGVATDETVHVNSRLEAGKLLTKLSGFDNKNSAVEEAGVGKGFSITINIGNEPVTIESRAEEIFDAQ